MGAYVVLTTNVLKGSGDNATFDNLITCAFTSAQTSMMIPYKLVDRLVSDDEFVAGLAANVCKGATIDLDSMMSHDASIKHDQTYLKARFNDFGDSLVRYDANKDMYYARRTSPAAFVRRFIVPAIEDAITAAVIVSLGIDPENITPSHLRNIVKTKATTSVENKVSHYTKGTTSADKANHNARKLSRRERKARAKASNK